MRVQAFTARFGLPLLQRELVQLAARRSTFLFRLLYAVVLYSAALWFYRGWLTQFNPDPESFESLGQGRPLFEMLVRWQFWGIYLFLPVMTCGALTVEKERQTLPLLQLTRLGGWTILLEKLASRLMAICTFLLLPLPLAAMAYGIGGIEAMDIVKSLYVLCLTAVQVACFSLLCSAWFRTTAGAIVGGYLIGAGILFYGSTVLRWVLLGAVSLGLHYLPWPGLDDHGREWLEASIQSGYEYQPLSGPWVFGVRQSDNSIHIWDFDGDISTNFGVISVLDTGGHMAEVELPYWNSPTSVTVIPISMEDVLVGSIPMIVSTILCLVLARVCLWRCAGFQRRSLLQSLFGLMDRLFVTINRNPLTRGITFGQIGRDLPDQSPVAWYQTRCKVVGRLRYLLRILLVIEMALITWFVWQAAFHPEWLAPVLSRLWMGGWLIVLMIVIAISTAIVPGERARQTLDVLLATPLPAKEIMLQSMAGLRRLMVVVCVPLLTILAFQVICVAWMSPRMNVPWKLLNYTDTGVVDLSSDLYVSGFAYQVEVDNPAMLAFRRVLATLMYLPLVGWIGLQYGLRLKNQFRAIMASVCTILVVCGVPSLIEWFIVTRTVSDVSELLVHQGTLAWLCWANPWFITFQGDGVDWGAIDPYLASDLLPVDWFPLLFHFLIVGGMLWGIRRNALYSFSRCVGRMEPATRQHVQRAVSPSSPQFNSEDVVIPESSGDEVIDVETTIPRFRG